MSALVFVGLLFCKRFWLAIFLPFPDTIYQVTFGLSSPFLPFCIRFLYIEA